MPNRKQRKPKLDVFGGELAHRLLFAEHHLHYVQNQHANAVAASIQEPVVLLLDLKDAIGEELARRLAGHDAVDEHLGKIRRVSALFSPIYTTALAYENALEILSSFFFVKRGIVPRPTNNGITVLIVSANGCTCATAPVAETGGRS